MRFAALFPLFLVLCSCTRPEPPKPPPLYLPDPTMSKDNRVITTSSTVMLGDSLTHIGVWAEWFPENNMANAGWGGDTTSRVLLRLESITRMKPRRIILLIGANDYISGSPLYLVSAGQRLIIDRIRRESPNTELVVQSVLPFGRNARVYNPAIPSTFVTDIPLLNTALKKFCEERGVAFLDTYRVMVDRNGYLNPEYTCDELHLSRPGYVAWTTLLGHFFAP